MRIGIVGGSIAGCSAAIELGRAGHDVTIAERSRGGLKGRGAGIGTPMETFRTLIERDLIDASTPAFIVSDHLFVGRTTDEDRIGHTALTLPLDMALLNWGDLWGQLRKRVPDGVYIEGREVTAATNAGDGVALTTSDGSRETYDLVLFGDGYQSLGRTTAFSEARISYRGYVLWRGVLDERDLSDSDPLERALFRLHYKGLPGNAVFYFVPGSRGSVARGARWVNWACYLPVEQDDLADFLVDRAGRRHQHSLPPGLIRPDEEQRLKTLVSDHLPPYFAEVVVSSRDTFAQPIFGVQVPAYARGRIGLLGDAGSVAPPFTGSGVFKAVMNAVDLTRALGQAETVDQALLDWSDEQTARGRRLAALGEQMEQAFVWAAPDFATMTEAAAKEWWKRAVSFPQEFSYVARERD